MKTIKLSFLCLLSFVIFSHQTASAQAGISWTGQNASEDDNWSGVTYGKGLFVAVGKGNDTSKVMTSPDGITWTSRTTPSQFGGLNSVTYGNGLFVAVGTPGYIIDPTIMTSPDGITWVTRTAPQFNIWTSVTYGNGLFVAVAGNSSFGSSIMTSPDGITWTSRTPINKNWTTITFGNGLFVAVADVSLDHQTDNAVMTSPDGITWTSQKTLSQASTWGSITYGNGLFVAVVRDGISIYTVMTSPNGINWTGHTTSSEEEGGWQSVTYGDGLFVAVGNHNQEVMTSPDGVTWTGRTAVKNYTWSCVDYSQGLFVAVAYAYSQPLPGGGTTRLQQVMTSGTLGVLAVNWLNISGILSSTNNTQLNWKVAEQNVKNYAIEKSNDGTHYNAVATIASKGNGENSYAFTETATLIADVWYRVKQIDNDGKFNYSSTVFITAKNLNNIKVYPNPARNAVTVMVRNTLLNKTARLTNIDGNLLQTVRITSSTITLNLQGYSAGVYLLKVENELPIKISKH